MRILCIETSPATRHLLLNVENEADPFLQQSQRARVQTVAVSGRRPLETIRSFKEHKSREFCSDRFRSVKLCKAQNYGEFASDRFRSAPKREKTTPAGMSIPKPAR